MVFASRMACILLCAGRSSRFAGGSKLEANLGGKPVGDHVSGLLAVMPFAARIAVVSQTGFRPHAHDFTITENSNPASGLGHSLSLGLRALGDLDVDAVLIALADMPLVSARHLCRLIAAYDAIGDIVGSSSGTTPMPPAIFPKASFPDLLNSQGDKGARTLLAKAQLVLASADELLDIDTEDDLARAEDLLRSVTRQSA